MGRPTKLTQEVERAICDALKAGATLRIAAEFAGIGERTLATWLASPAPRFQQFQQAVKQATARGDVGALAVIQKAAKDGTWQAAAWLLERRHPAEYGRRQVVAVQRAVEPDEEQLAAAAARGVRASDAAVLWQRQLAVLEHAYSTGQIDAVTYLERMDRLGAQAARLAELDARAKPLGQDTPRLQLSLSLGSDGIVDNGALPPDVAGPARAPAGGDLIDVG